MKIDNTTLLDALKHQHPHEPKEPTDAEKIEVANELHEWLHSKESEK